MSIRRTPNSDLARRFIGLGTLSSELLNGEWDFEFGDPHDAARAMAERFPDEVSSCIAGIEALFAECPNEAARAGELERLGWGYAPKMGQLDLFLQWTHKMLKQGAVPETAAG